jgi:predicted DNA-binding transcriptional regulator AlpA
MKQEEKKVLGFGPSGNKAVIELDGKRYFSSAETARILGMCASSFYAAMKKGLLPEGVRVGRRKYYSEKELGEFIFHNKSGDK